MVIAAFSMIDKANRIGFFEKTFIMAKVSPNEILEMFFFILSDVDIDFLKKKL